MPEIKRKQTKQPRKGRRDFSVSENSNSVARTTPAELQQRAATSVPEDFDPNRSLPEGYEIDTMGLQGEQIVKTARLVGQLAEESPDLIEAPDANVKIQAVPKDNIAGAWATTTVTTDGSYVINVARDAFSEDASLLKTTVGHEIVHAKLLSEGLGRSHPADVARHELEAHAWEMQNQGITGDKGRSAYRSKRHYARRYKEAKRNHPGATSGLPQPRRPY